MNQAIPAESSSVLCHKLICHGAHQAFDSNLGSRRETVDDTCDVPFLDRYCFGSRVTPNDGSRLRIDQLGGDRAFGVDSTTVGLLPPSDLYCRSVCTPL